MEEKRRDAGAQPEAKLSAATAVSITPLTPSEPPATEPPSSRRRGGQKRKVSSISGGNTSTPPTTSSKRQAREKPLAVPFLPIHNGPCTRARQQPYNISSPSASIMAAKSEVEAAEIGGGFKSAEELNAEKEDWEALEAKIEAEYEAIRSRDANTHVVPIFSGWFSWTKVHPLEEQALPSFFNGKSESRSREIYIAIRNWIMMKFHTNPNTQIESKDLSELSVGELGARQEVMEFLDYWGLINYNPFPDSDTASVSADMDEGIGNNSLVEKLYHFETEQSSAPMVHKTNVATPAVASKLFPESAIAEELVRPDGPSVDYHCNSCSADCSRKRYHCQKQADFDLCTECFNNSKFGSDMSPLDFILMEPAEAAGASGGKWTDQETLLLLEAFELYKENWNEIAEHVATKTKAQCILHFIQMPIEDMFLDGNDKMDTKENVESVPTNSDTLQEASETTDSKDDVANQLPSSSPVEISKAEDVGEPSICLEIGENCAMKALKEAFEAVGYFPSPAEEPSFAEAGNPVMALAAFLVRLVEPNFATASARYSLKSIIPNNSSGLHLAARHVCFLESPGEKDKTADSRSTVTKTIEDKTQKDDNQLNAKQSEEKLNSSDLTNDCHNEENKESIAKEKPLFSANGDCRDKSRAITGPEALSSREHNEPAQLNEANRSELSNEQASSTVENLDNFISKVELPPRSSKELENGASLEGPSEPTEASKDEDIMSESLPLEKKELEQQITSSSMVGNEANRGEEEEKECRNSSKDHLEGVNNESIHQLKCAAVTALSAAAVKAKLLASQEEDQIRQLAMYLVEKQLHKMEIKLTFFSEMENVVMRVREQLERSKQRLFHERAQIIASRLGISAASSRPMTHSLPINRAAMAFANTVPRQSPSMTPQRPSISRPIMSSNPSIPSTVAGSLLQASNQGKFSSV